MIQKSVEFGVEEKVNDHTDQTVVMSLKNIDKYFGDVHVVKNLSLEIKKGEILTLLGPSGCGKTTTLRMAIGLETIDGGEIIYNGEPVDSKEKKVFVPTNKRRMGMVFQSYAIWPQMTVFENVAYPLRVLRKKRDFIKQEVHRVLELVGLTHVADRPSPMLSGGQQQRVAFARSLICNPDILLLDEPFSNLDAQLREQMRFEVKQLQQQLGITILFVTHDQVEALSISDRIVVMNEGNVEQIGTPKDLYNLPCSPFVRDFLGKTILLSGYVNERMVQGARLAVDGNTDKRIDAFHPLSMQSEVGEDVVASIRPEKISVVPFSQENFMALSKQDEKNLLVGKIDVLFFIGNSSEARITLENNKKSISFELPHLYSWYEGQDVILTFPKKETRLWPS